jgi:hypothetical protein
VTGRIPARMTKIAPAHEIKLAGGYPAFSRIANDQCCCPSLSKPSMIRRGFRQNRPGRGRRAPRQREPLFYGSSQAHNIQARTSRSGMVGVCTGRSCSLVGIVPCLHPRRGRSPRCNFSIWLFSAVQGSSAPLCFQLRTDIWSGRVLHPADSHTSAQRSCGPSHTDRGLESAWRTRLLAISLHRRAIPIR